MTKTPAYCGYCKEETSACIRSKQPTCDKCGLLRSTTMTTPAEPKSPEEWAEWMFNHDPDAKYVVEAIRRAQEQAFEAGRKHEQHQTKVIPESLKKSYYDLGRKEGIEECAKESESWFEMFNFDSFHSDDPRRCANPNQIGARIRALLEKP